MGVSDWMSENRGNYNTSSSYGGGYSSQPQKIYQPWEQSQGSNPFNLPILSGGLGALGAGIGQLFGGGRNPADAGMGDLDEIEGMMHGYYDPYIQRGERSWGTLEDQYGKLINDPTAMMKRFGSGFQASPGYQYQVDQATRAANQAGAAGGMLGSPAEQAMLSKDVMGLANQDYYNYMNNVMGLYGQGLSGMSHIGDIGYHSTNSLAEQVAQAQAAKAQMKYAGQANQNQGQGGGLGSMIGGAASLASFLF